MQSEFLGSSIIATFLLALFVNLGASFLNHDVEAAEISTIQIKNTNAEIPFKLERNKIILPVKINDHRPLNIILDSGMPWSGMYLFHSEFLIEFGLSSNISVSVGGAGTGDPSSALQVNGINLNAGDAEFAEQMVVVSRSEHTQDFPTDGVIGWSIFSHPLVYVDYDKEVIRLLDQLPELDSAWSSIDIELHENHLPFFEFNVAVNETDEPQKMRFYLDLAAGEHLEMLVRPEMKFTIPETGNDTILGTGLSGSFKGSKGEIAYVNFGGNELRNLPSTFPDSRGRSKQGNNIDGIVGNGLMKQFNTIYDYPNKKIYIQPSKHFNP